MKTKAVRMHGIKDLRMDEYELPPIGPDELLVRVVSDSLCMSSYKAVSQGSAHKRVSENLAERPVVIGHEFCGEILEVGENRRDEYRVGEKFSIQPAMSGTYDTAGYSFPNIGGDSQYGIIPAIYLEQKNVLRYSGEGWFFGSLAEPLSCVIGAAHANYHQIHGRYEHFMGVKEGGNLALLAGAGPMGLAMIDYMIHGDRKPGRLVVTDINEERLARAAEILSPKEAKNQGVELIYLNTAGLADSTASLMALCPGGYDDVFVFAPIPAVIEQGDALLAYDGCLNFFAGPNDAELSAKFNFYDVHYNLSHVVGTSGGNSDDMREALELSGAGRINPAILVTHVGGLDAVIDATLHLPELPGGKKLIYTHISMPLTAIADFGKQKDPLFAELDAICQRHGGLWSLEAEEYLLENGKQI